MSHGATPPSLMVLFFCVYLSRRRRTFGMPIATMKQNQLQICAVLDADVLQLLNAYMHLQINFFAHIYCDICSFAARLTCITRVALSCIDVKIQKLRTWSVILI